MMLTDTQFNEITQSITVLGNKPVLEADRRSPRVELNTQISIQRWSAPSESWSCVVRDFSRGGMGFMHSNRISLDEQVVARLPRGNGESILLLGSVIYWEPLAENLYTVGVHFQREVSEEELNKQTAKRSIEHTSMFGRLIRRRKVA